ncbi:hypothetical protein D3C76_66150 [compost metagenome]
MTKYLIINGDDYGMSEAINRGIIGAHAFGTLSSASLLVNMPAFEQAVDLAHQSPALGIGLHFNLTEGKSISAANDIPSLVQSDGYFSRIFEEWAEGQIEQELLQQYNKMVLAGLQPTHIDSHHHIHLIVPSVYHTMERFVKRFGIPIRLNQRLQNKLSPPRSTDFLILDTYASTTGTSKLLEHISHLDSGSTEIMTHPGFPEKTGESNATEPDLRGKEYIALTDYQVKNAIHEQEIQLIHYGQLENTRTDQQENDQAAHFGNIESVCVEYPTIDQQSHHDDNVLEIIRSSTNQPKARKRSKYKRGSGVVRRNKIQRKKNSRKAPARRKKGRAR